MRDARVEMPKERLIIRKLYQRSQVYLR